MRPAQFITAILTAAALTACSSKKVDKFDPKEIVQSDLQISDTPESTLLADAKKFYSGQMYSLAERSFRMLRDSYPFGPYRQYAAIKVADCLFAKQDYPTAAVLYGELLSGEISASNMPYIMLQLGRSHQLSSRGVGRDAAPLNKALQAYNNLLSTFPDSIYSQSAVHYRNEVLHSLAQYHKLVLDFYKKRDQEPAHSKRKAVFEEKWQQYLTPPLAPTGERLQTTQSYAVLPAEHIQQPVITAVLRKPAKDDLSISEPVTAGPPSSIGETANLDDVQITSIECLPGREWKITIYLNSYHPEIIRDAPFVLQPLEGKVSLKLPIAVEPRVMSCLGKLDLNLLASGLLSMEIAQPVLVEMTQFPAAILISNR